MKRFILLSFGFLGWAFYEMSGGADFDAQEMRTARLEAAEAVKVAKAESKPAAAVVVAKAPKVVVETDPPLDTNVTRVSLNLASVSALQGTQSNVSDTVTQNAAIVTSSADTPAIIPSLIDPTDGLTVAVTSSESRSFDDIRTVSGNRVNVRGGPGTDFGIVARLVRGDAVKIIQDDGNGWVRFEALNGDASGWMADFLLSDG